MYKELTKYLLVSILLHSQALLAETIPYFAVNQEINFGAVLFVPGNCTMNHVNGSFSNINPDTMCGTGGNGVPGRYVIVADPNEQVSIKISQRNNLGDGIMYIPQGELVSDTETHAITADVAQEIDSGSSGVININVGGRLFLITSQTPGSNLGFTFVNGIEWSVLP